MDARILLLVIIATLAGMGHARAATPAPPPEATHALPPDTTGQLPSALTVTDSEARMPRSLMIKTNALPWCGTIMNIEGEIQLSSRFSFSLPIWYCPWFIAERHALRVAAFQPEVRRWFKNPGEGHFLGIHASVAWFNLRFNDYRYQDYDRPLLGGGITYGYALRFNPHWGLEFSCGVGYMNIQYDRYYNVPNGQLADKRKTSYFGLDHLSVSIVYYIEL